MIGDDVLKHVELVVVLVSEAVGSLGNSTKWVALENLSIMLRNV